MNELISDNVKIINTVEVAEMMEVPHAEILKKLEGTTKVDGSIKTKGIIPVLNEGNFPVVDYFIKSSYKDRKGEERPCYDCTKMGCELLANKFTGEKGIVFTAKYVKRFNEMEKIIKVLTHEEQLALKLYRGGTGSIEAHKELVGIEVQRETAKIKDGTNKLLST